MRKFEMDNVAIRPPHLFLSIDGALYDTRNPNWSTLSPLRTLYSYTHGVIRTSAAFKATLRGGAYAWPGGYPLFFLTDDGAALCFSCARKEVRQILSAINDRRSDGWRVVACDINHEATDLFCDHCSQQIESAYGD